MENPSSGGAGQQQQDVAGDHRRCGGDPGGGGGPGQGQVGRHLDEYSVSTSAANRLIGEVVQSRRRPLLGTSYKTLC